MPQSSPPRDSELPGCRSHQAELVRLFAEIASVAQIAVVQGESWGLSVLSKFMRILIQVIYSGSVETTGTALDPMHLIALLQKQLRQVASILASDASYEGLFAVAHGRHFRW